MTMMESNSSMNPLHGFFDIELELSTLTLFSSFPPMVALSFLVSCCKFNPLHVDRIYPLKYDQNYLGGSSAGLSLVFGGPITSLGTCKISRRCKSLQLNPEPSLGRSMKTS
uniref:Uncharacterized protein n=1 Tax=Nicotiana tabacum TaxID=4097 RepID=A0A1S4DRD5_TOBAC|nr:PREDICTED: uncharacterized protein LOC107832640 [Nicotiana tabacum]